MAIRRSAVCIGFLGTMILILITHILFDADHVKKWQQQWQRTTPHDAKISSSNSSTKFRNALNLLEQSLRLGESANTTVGCSTKRANNSQELNLIECVIQREVKKALLRQQHQKTVSARDHNSSCKTPTLSVTTQPTSTLQKVITHAPRQRPTSIGAEMQLFIEKSIQRLIKETKQVHSQTHSLLVHTSIPKTGSTTFSNMARELSKTNPFRALFMEKKNYRGVLSILDQKRFAEDLLSRIKEYSALIHGHYSFMDFTRFGYKNPFYTSIVREPISRMVSHYYFLKYGDDISFHPIPADNQTFDDCIKLKGPACDIQERLWVQVPYFCGYAPQCLEPTRWSLDQAKYNLINYYLLVGVTGRLGDFFTLLEAMLPQYFTGAYKLFAAGKFGHLRKTVKKLPPSEETLETIKQTKVYQMEQEFYELAVRMFETQEKSLIRNKTDKAAVNTPSFRVGFF